MYNGEEGINAHNTVGDKPKWNGVQDLVIMSWNVDKGILYTHADAKDKKDADDINQNASDTTTDDNSDEGIENKTDKNGLAKDKDMVKKDDVSNKKTS